MQPGFNLFDGQGAHTRRRKLDGEWDAVQAMTDGSDGRGISVGERKGGLMELRPLGKQKYRLVLPRAFCRRRLSALR